MSTNGNTLAAAIDNLVNNATFSNPETEAEQSVAWIRVALCMWRAMADGNHDSSWFEKTGPNTKNGQLLHHQIS
jgi:hypothetical protein